MWAHAKRITVWVMLAYLLKMILNVVEKADLPFGAFET